MVTTPDDRAATHEHGNSAKSRLRAIVYRVARAAGIDPAAVPVSLVKGQGDWHVACVDWPADGPFLACRVGAYGADAAVDAVEASYADSANRGMASAERDIADAREKLARWSAVGAAIESAE